MLVGSEPDNTLFPTSRCTREAKVPAEPHVGGRAPVKMLVPRLSVFTLGRLVAQVRGSLPDRPLSERSKVWSRGKPEAGGDAIECRKHVTP